MTNLKRIILAAALTVLALPLAAWSEESAAQATHRQAATELLDVMDASTSMTGFVVTLIDSQIESSPALAPYRDIYIQWMEKTLSWDVIGPRMVDLYTAAFTEVELRELLAFYKSPIGQKALKQMPVLFERGAKIGEEAAAQNMGELEKMIEARRKEIEGKDEP
jgi:hypothetical protein